MGKEILEDLRNTEAYLEIYIPERISGDFAGKSVVTVDQFERRDLDLLFNVAQEMRNKVRRHELALPLMDYVLANIFYEPSTRTDMSFQAAMARLGGRFISASSGVEFSSVAKGESLADTIRAIACYADVIVLRHPKVGASYEAAYYSKMVCKKLEKPNVPIISAGDGIGEHPTQGFLDLFTIVDKFGEAHGKTVVMVGDLKNGRTVHSLSKLLAKMDSVRLICVSPESLKMPPGLVNQLRYSGCVVKETPDLMGALPTADIIYLTRVQKERFADPDEYESIKDFYVITPEILSSAPRHAIFCHPLPRVSEMGTPEQQDILDADPRSFYFHQMENGLFVRMALLAAVLGKV